MALLWNAPAVAGSNGVPVTIRINVVPGREDSLMAADIKLRQPDGTLIVLTAQEKARYIKDPASLKTVAGLHPSGLVVVTVEY